VHQALSDQVDGVGLQPLVVADCVAGGDEDGRQRDVNGADAQQAVAVGRVADAGIRASLAAASERVKKPSSGAAVRRLKELFEAARARRGEPRR